MSAKIATLVKAVFVLFIVFKKFAVTIIFLYEKHLVVGVERKWSINLVIRIIIFPLKYSKKRQIYADSAHTTQF